MTVGIIVACDRCNKVVELNQEILDDRDGIEAFSELFRTEKSMEYNDLTDEYEDEIRAEIKRFSIHCHNCGDFINITK